MYFSEYFNIPYSVVDKYGALDISLASDMPVFVDPFCLYASDKPEYNNLHKRIIEYLRYLRDISGDPVYNTKGALKSLFAFPEVPNTFIGFCVKGSSGHGLGLRFATALESNLSGILGDFGKEKISNDSHIEKLCIVCQGVGVDCISDFAINLIKDYLLTYTQTFAEQYLQPEQRTPFPIQHAYFDFSKKVWRSKRYVLPHWEGKYIILIPKDILTKDDTWINKEDLVRDIRNIPDTIGNEELKARLIQTLDEILDEKRGLSQEEKRDRLMNFYMANPEAIDWYIKGKECRKQEAIASAAKKICQIEEIARVLPVELMNRLKATDFYKKPNSLAEVVDRANLFQREVENCDVYRVFYQDGKKCITEAMVQLMFRLVWCESKFFLAREVNNGRGPADFVISYGSGDVCVIEIKLASNSHIEKNLKNQIDIYKAANKTEHGICMIVFTDDKEKNRVERILKRLGLENNPYIIRIDARNGKASASNA